MSVETCKAKVTKIADIVAAKLVAPSILGSIQAKPRIAGGSPVQLMGFFKAEEASSADEKKEK